MRYDSDPQVVRRILTETDIVQDSLDHANSSATASPALFDELTLLFSPFLHTLEHFSKLHTFNPQFSLSRFSAYHIEQKLIPLQESISKLFRRKQFTSLDEQVEWNFRRFLHSPAIVDNEQLLISLYKRIVQTLETYYVEHIRKTHIAAVLNDAVGWSEHIETHGHHDIHSVILFAEKVARDIAVIEHRLELVRDICMLIEERTFLQRSSGSVEQTLGNIALDLSQVYSAYLLELYEALLEDMEIIAIANQDYQAFETYCHENEIEVYEEYRDVIKNHLREYIEIIAGDISSALHILKTANLFVHAEHIYKRYLDVDGPTEVLGENLSEDIRMLDRAIHHLKDDQPELSRQYAVVSQKIKKMKGEIMKPAIQVYGEYMKDPMEFFRLLPQNQTTWIPILDSALACLEPDDDLYQKCRQLRKGIDEFVGHSSDTS